MRHPSRSIPLLPRSASRTDTLPAWLEYSHAQLDVVVGEHSALCPGDDGLGERMRQPVEMRFARAARELVHPERNDLAERRRVQFERRVGPESGVVRQLEPGQRHQPLLIPIERRPRRLIADPQLLPHLVVEVLQQLVASATERVADLEIQLQLQFIERGLNLLGLSALLIDRCNALLEIHA